LIVELHN